MFAWLWFFNMICDLPLKKKQNKKKKQTNKQTVTASNKRGNSKILKIKIKNAVVCST